MSSNKDLAKQLEAMRHKAKEAASAESAPTPEAKAAPEVLSAGEPTSKEERTPNLKVLTSRKPEKQGRGAKAHTALLERTTITLKAGDNAALSDLQTFLMKRARKAASTSTLIRLALFYTKQALTSDAESLAKAYHQIQEEDGRRKVANV